MLNLKKQFIKNYLGVQIIGDRPGELTIRIQHLNQLEDKYKVDDVYVLETIKLLKGVQDVIVDYDNNVVRIAYNPLVLEKKKVYDWVNKIIDVTIDQSEYIKKNWEKDKDMVVKQVQSLL